MKVDEPDALPLLPGEQVHLEARLNQPAYAYLLWLDGQGHVSLLYPRQDSKFGSSPSGGSARETRAQPGGAGRVAPDERPRRAGDGAAAGPPHSACRRDTDLAGLVGPLPPSPLRTELEVAMRGV